jgi:L-aspartate oxidase
MNDVAIIGSGIAGTLAALHLHDLRPDLHITVFSKGALGDGASSLAQGGIALPRLDVDGDLEQHVHDTIAAGRGLNEEAVVREIISEAPRLIATLEHYGIRFDREDDGYHYSREGGHHIARVIHATDATGATIMQQLHVRLRATPNVTIVEHYTVTPSRLSSIVGRRSSVVLAMGGSGQRYRYTSNPPGATGDALLIAEHLGLPVRDLEWMQFHPTAAFTVDNRRTMPLITEALRGAGAHIVDEGGRRFVFDTDARGELAPRDIVTASILDTIATQQVDHVYLDCRHMDMEILGEHFPTFLRTCADLGYDPRYDRIPIRPAAHYQCGGIEATISGRTRLDGIYAIGECARTGMHGANRLASNSLLEAGVMALRCAEEIAIKM